MSRILLLLLLLASMLLCPTSSTENWQWVESVNVSKWYSPLDLCILSNDTTSSMDDVLQHCRHQLDLQNTPYNKHQPIR